ncbi:hypothetical protein FPZ24_08645 [Sphingomonas panacisoli]|uniref:Uncharacterized protein n=1 Tax=Sphingomonas panacisoli TaxID=1813879 RepID=A0A5B8LI35_9SPHN|nr:hypothetical protein [Sphingomonas panacisoli]QDZ07546.1 hypothetical protein FPZ24_08645 [Sphingomonas panacisoli]
MSLASAIRLGLVNAVVSILLFGAVLMGLIVLFDPRANPLTWPFLATTIVTLVGPGMLVIDLVAAAIASMAKKSISSAHLVALIVAICLALGYLGAGRVAIIRPDIIGLIRCAFVAALALPWLVGAGIVKVARKPA